MRNIENCKKYKTIRFNVIQNGYSLFIHLSLEEEMCLWKFHSLECT